MYILSGKGSVAGVDFAKSALNLCQKKGVLWDNDLPEYTLDFATQIPSISKSIREGNSNIVIKEINYKLSLAEQQHSEYIILCLTAHKLIPQLHTKMHCINLWDYIKKSIGNTKQPIAFLGTIESKEENNLNLLTLPNHAETIGDLITSVKRGYFQLGKNYAAHPYNLLKNIVIQFKKIGAEKFFLACTDLQYCKNILIELGVAEKDIISIIDIAANAFIERSGRVYDTDFLDLLSDNRTYLRYKYLSKSDAPQTEKKTQHLEKLISKIQPFDNDNINILDIGGSSTGHSLRLAKQLTNKSCHITLLDISSSSLAAAKTIHDAEKKHEAEYINESIENYHPEKYFDAVLCVGVLLYVSSDQSFEKVIQKISNFIKPNGILVTRDCLHENEKKEYMSFGGVIRNRSIYEDMFKKFGMIPIESEDFIIEEPISRNIVATIWKKI